MSSFNRIILMGNLTRDPEVRQSQTGTFIVKAGIAVNERMPDGQGGWKDEASFFDMVIFGKRAEAFSRFMRKGRTVLVEGKLRQGRWQDKETGQNRSKIEVIVDSWEFAGGRGDEAGGGGGQQQAPASAGGFPAGAAPDFPGPADFGGAPAPQNPAPGGFPDDVPF
ncbi:MAG: single-stranded DNA-binding protein [Planctomycetes bacterium]|nr:single-stranded DNA-binding protein [Planctomycetota bacterium]